MAKPLKLSDRGKSWARQSNNRRKKGTRKERRYILIVCEGTKTEPNYFESLKSDLPKGTVQIEIHGEGRSTLSLVKRAEEIQKRMLRLSRTVDQVWVVFDRDSFKPDAFDNAIQKAKSKNYGVAWSNESFELWYLLHFEDQTTAISRTEFEKKLSVNLGRPYKKNACDMYEKLGDKLPIAVARAEDLVKQNIGILPHNANPCTKVHELVKLLEDLRER